MTVERTAKRADERDFDPAGRLRALAVAALCAGTAVLAPFAAHAQGDTPSQLMATIEKLLPGAKPDAVLETPISGLYEVSFGTQIIYMSGDGVYMLRGDLVNVSKRENVTENQRRKARRARLDGVSANEMIGFGPDEPKATITVFTDVDCPYCSKLHNDMPELMQLGIAVRYLAFPRQGVESPTYSKMVSVWCATDRQSAMTTAKAGGEVASAECDNPVSAHFALGQDLGVRGTPTIVLENGSVLPGYLPPNAIMENISQQSGS